MQRHFAETSVFKVSGAAGYKAWGFGSRNSVLGFSEKFFCPNKQQKKRKTKPKKAFFNTFCNKKSQKYCRYSEKNRKKGGFPFYKTVFKMKE